VLGLDTAETCRGWRSTLRISCALNWFYLHDISDIYHAFNIRSSDHKYS
jgi:hypothetical protein